MLANLNHKVIGRTAFYIGLVSYTVAYLLPSFGDHYGTMLGYECFLLAVDTLLNWDGIINYIGSIFANLSNVFVVANIYWFFRKAWRHSYLIAPFAVLSALYWILVLLEDGIALKGLMVGYWIWTISILLMSLHLYDNRLKH